MDLKPFDLSCFEQLQDRFQNIFEPELINDICKFGKLSTIANDTVILDIGDYVENLPLIISGSLRIMTEDDEGKELLLYYLELGDTCAVTLNCMTGRVKSKIRAISETECEILFIPMEKVEEWMGKYATWRRFVMDTFNNRMNELLEAVDSLAFHNMEERLLKYLRDKAMVTGSTLINTTHYQIASEMHSSRVVISRVLKKLEMDGLITQYRNHITLKNL